MPIDSADQSLYKAQFLWSYLRQVSIEFYDINLTGF